LPRCNGEPAGAKSGNNHHSHGDETKRSGSQVGLTFEAGIGRFLSTLYSLEGSH
jgi:hypothetical protein